MSVDRALVLVLLVARHTQAILAVSETRLDRLVVGDIDDDGHPEFLMARGSSIVRLAVDSSRGAFATTTIATLPEHDVGAFAVGDVTGDGLPDLVVAERGFQMDQTWLIARRRDGSYDAAELLLDEPAVDELFLYDMNLDDLLDVVLVERGASQIQLFIQRGGGLIDAGAFPTGGTPDDGTAVADVTCDGCPDVIIPKGPRITLLRGLGCDF